MFKSIRLSTFNLLNPLIISLLVLSLWLVNIPIERTHLREQSAKFEREYLDSQKQLLQFMVSNSVDFIRFKQSQIEQRIKESLRRRVYEAHRMAEQLHSQNQGTLSEVEIQRQILLVLESLRFNEGRGYYFVYSLDGRELLSSERFSPTGAEGAPRQEETKNMIFRLVDITENEGEGFYRYSWSKPGAGGQNYPKISFVKRFEAYGWLIGTGEYVDDMKAEIQNEVIQWIDHLRFSEVGYVWIHDTDLNMVVHPFYGRDSYPDWYQRGGLSEYADPDGKRLFVEMRDRCLEQGSGFVSYLWGKPNQEGVYHKLSYVELIGDWGWIAGAGVYIDDLENAIRQNNSALDAYIRKDLIRLLAIVAFILLLSLILTRFFHIKITGAFRLFNGYFRNAALSKNSLDPSSLHFLEFKEMARYVNNMVEDRRAADEKLKISEEQLLQAQKMEAIGRLAGGIAHDFSNLLMAIIGYAEMMLWNPDLEKKVRSALEEIQKAAERASSLTHQLLAFSRKQILQPVVLNLNNQIVDLERMLRRIIGEDIDLVTDLNPGIGLMEADQVQIEQVILNLAVNARDAMPQGGAVRISTRNAILDEGFCAEHVPTEPGSYVLLEFSDTGIGMDADIKEHLFEPFFTTKELGKGTGLGLSTVYGIVKQSDGYIWVQSEPGRGATFSIYFPLIEKQGSEKEAREEPTALVGGKETILLVEDEKVVRQMISSTLQRVGYQVIEADNGKKALQLARSTKKSGIGLILTDVIMPDMSGDQLADRLPLRHRKTPILFMSGYPGSRDLGSRPYIQKPFAPKYLCTRIRELLTSG